MSSDEPPRPAAASDEIEEPLVLRGPALPRWLVGAVLLALAASGLLTAWMILSG